MDAVLKSVLDGQTDNYLLPFFWLHSGSALLQMPVFQENVAPGS